MVRNYSPCNRPHNASAEDVLEMFKEAVRPVIKQPRIIRHHCGVRCESWEALDKHAETCDAPTRSIAHSADSQT